MYKNCSPESSCEKGGREISTFMGETQKGQENDFSFPGGMDGFSNWAVKICFGGADLEKTMFTWCKSRTRFGCLVSSLTWVSKNSSVHVYI